jgi:hypothetical protein
MDLYGDYRLVLEWLSSIPEQLSIHTLHFTTLMPLPQDLDTINMFLRALGPSLEVFGCNSNGMFIPSAPTVELLYILPLEDFSIDLTYNTHLRSVDFHFGGSEGFPEDVFAMSTLSRMGSRQLEQVAFHLTSPSWEDDDFPNAEWVKMDTILASSQFATIKRVHISAFPCPPDVAKLSALFATLLPTCHARGIISFVDPPPW